MKIVQINSTCGVGSTGRICVGISQLLNEHNIENYILYGNETNGYNLGISCSDAKYIKVQALKSKMFGNYGFNSTRATQRMIAELRRIQPDIVHLHNLHSHDCDLFMLFNYFKKYDVKIVWTFHDCWAFTGYCTYFDLCKCEKWKVECKNCPQKRSYSWLFDKSCLLFNLKKELFGKMDITIVTPSQWLCNLVKKSFLKHYPVEVIKNGIDTTTFKPLRSDFRKKYSLENKKIILGVASVWEKRKGIDVFFELRKRLPNEYHIVLVGTNSKLDRNLPSGITSIHKTQNQQELAEIYSAADLFVNPTREENYPTVNLEAISCGTPVLTFNTGGSAEMVDDTCGVVVECNDIESLEKEIIRLCMQESFTQEQCCKKAKEFNKNDRFKEYLELYRRINKM